MKDRVEFLESMEKLRRDKVYRAYIVFQLREKLAEMKKMFPLRVEEVVKGLDLCRIDPSLDQH